MGEIETNHGDTTQQHVGAIVKAANSAIPEPGVLAECRNVDGCEPGAAKLNGGYQLPAK